MDSSHMNYTDNSQNGGGAAASGPLKMDVSHLQRPNNIRNDKELEIEITKICEVLKDTCKLPFDFKNSHFIESHDWKKRTEALKRVQEISLLFDDVVEGTVGIHG